MVPEARLCPWLIDLGEISRAFFGALWNRGPFAWQKELATRVLEREESSPLGR